MKRQIRIKDNESRQISTHVIEAATFGELQKELGVSWSNNTIIVRETKVTLKLAKAKLPEGDFTIYVLPAKTKAGQNFDTLSFQELRTECKKAGLTANGVTSTEMRENLKEHYAGDSKTVERNSEKEELIVKLQEVIEGIKNLSTTESNPYLQQLGQMIEQDFAEVKKELEL